MHLSAPRISMVVFPFLASVLGAYTVACSSATSKSAAADSGAKDVDSGDTSDSGGADDGGTGGTDEGGTTTNSADMACAKMASTGCNDCCIQHHSAGVKVFNDAFDKCVCDPSSCATACANFSDCSSDPDAGASAAGDSCDTCKKPLFADGGACDTAINSACGASADCVAYSDCANACP